MKEDVVISKGGLTLRPAMAWSYSSMHVGRIIAFTCYHACQIYNTGKKHENTMHRTRVACKHLTDKQQPYC